MTYDYARIAASADRMLQKYGAAGQLRRTEQGEYDPGAGSATPTETSQDVTAVVFAYPQHLINGTTVLQGDEQAYLSAVGITEPKPLDVLTWQGADYTTISAKRLAPAGVTVLWELQVRK